MVDTGKRVQVHRANLKIRETKDGFDYERFKTENKAYLLSPTHVDEYEDIRLNFGSFLVLEVHIPARPKVRKTKAATARFSSH